MDRDAFIRVMTDGALSWEDLNPIGYIFYPVTAQKTEKYKLINTSEMDKGQYKQLVDFLLSVINDLSRKKIAEGKILTVPISETRVTLLYCFGSVPGRVEKINEKEIQMIMPKGQVLAFYSKNGQNKAVYYFS